HAHLPSVPTRRSSDLPPGWLDDDGRTRVVMRTDRVDRLQGPLGPMRGDPQLLAAETMMSRIDRGGSSLSERQSERFGWHMGKDRDEATGALRRDASKHRHAFRC